MIRGNNLEPTYSLWRYNKLPAQNAAAIHASGDFATCVQRREITSMHSALTTRQFPIIGCVLDLNRTRLNLKVQLSN